MLHWLEWSYRDNHSSSKCTYIFSNNIHAPHLRAPPVKKTLGKERFSKKWHERKREGGEHRVLGEHTGSRTTAYNTAEERRRALPCTSSGTSLVISFIRVSDGFLLQPSPAHRFSARAEDWKEGCATCRICRIACCLQHWNCMVVADVEAHMVLIISSSNLFFHWQQSCNFWWVE